jgi:hypothetical protein
MLWSWQFTQPRSGMFHFIVTDGNTAYLLSPSLDD